MYQFHVTDSRPALQYATAIKRVKHTNKLQNYDTTMTIIGRQAQYDPYCTIMEMMHTQYIMKQGMKIFGEKLGKLSVNNELENLCMQDVFGEIDYNSLTPEQIRMALNVLMFMTQKRDGSIKSRGCIDGRPQQLWTNKHETASLTPHTKSVKYTCQVDEIGRAHV